MLCRCVREERASKDRFRKAGRGQDIALIQGWPTLRIKNDTVNQQAQPIPLAPLELIEYGFFVSRACGRSKLRLSPRSRKDGLGGRPIVRRRTPVGGMKMFRGVASLLGLFFVTAGVFAVASLTKTPAASPVAPPRAPGVSVGPRYLAMEAPAFHARPSLN